MSTLAEKKQAVEHSIQALKNRRATAWAKLSAGTDEEEQRFLIKKIDQALELGEGLLKGFNSEEQILGDLFK